MGRSVRLADMNEVYVYTKTARKDQLVIHLWHMEEKFGGLTLPKKGRACTEHGDGPNVCHHQPKPRYTGAKDKFIPETWWHMEEQFTVLRDQIKGLTTQFSNMGGYNKDGSRDPSVERKTYGHQHRAQAHANQWENRFKLNILKFQGDLQLEEFLD